MNYKSIIYTFLIIIISYLISKKFSRVRENYYSPFRPDARHLKGVFLAIHAFVPTIYILMKAYKN